MMGSIYKVQEIDFKTNLCFDDVMYLTKLYIDGQGEDYEIDETVLYHTTSCVEDGAGEWHVDIIELKIKQTFPDAYTTLVIPDKDEWIIYLRNWHGAIYEKINLLTNERFWLE